jgi:hypothetical protein
MSFDAWVVGFGISTLLRELQIVESAAAYLVLAAVAVVDAILLYRFFSKQRTLDETRSPVPPGLTSAGQDVRY